MNTIKSIKIPKDEVLRYLGYKKQIIDNNTMGLVNETINEAQKIIELKYILSKNKCILKDGGVHVEGTKLTLLGNDIKEHLKNSKEVLLLAVTLGREIEKRISYYEKINLTKAVILDSCATAAVEELCDEIEIEIKKEMIKENEDITFRYSPGYGDLPLDIQSDFLKSINAEKLIGLTVSSHNLLMPRKSVTAVIGIIDKKYEQHKKGCEVCKNYENCSFRREGISCGR